MAQLYLGVVRGFSNSSDYGAYHAYLNYTSSGTTIYPSSISLSETVSGKYTTNTITINSLTIAGTAISLSNNSFKGYSNGKKVTSWTVNCSGSVNAGGTSAAVKMTWSRSGSSGHKLSGTITGLATAPSGLYCNLSSKTETRVTLSGGYSSNGGANVTSSGYQYSTNNSTWSAFSNGSTNLSPNTRYYFRYYATNAAGTSYSGSTPIDTYQYPYVSGISANPLTIGNSQTLTLYNPLKRTVNVYMKKDSTDGSLIYSGSTSETSITFTPSADTMYSLIPSTQEATACYYCTYNNGNIKSTPTGKFKITGNEKPTFDTSYLINIIENSYTAITGSNSKFIQGFNKCTGVIKPMVAKNHAEGSYYTINANGVSSQTVSHTGSNLNFTLNNMTSKTITVTAVDTRGLATTATYDVNMTNYTKPSYTEGTLLRQDGTGLYALLTLIGKYTNWTGLSKTNSIQKVQYRYKPNTSGGTYSSWINITSKLSSNSSGIWQFLNKALDQQFTNTQDYLLQFAIDDLLCTNVLSTEFPLSTAKAFIWKDLANNRLGINKKPTEALDVAGNIKGSGNVEAPNIKGNALYINGVKMLWYE